MRLWGPVDGASEHRTPTPTAALLTFHFEGRLEVGDVHWRAGRGSVVSRDRAQPRHGCHAPPDGECSGQPLGLVHRGSAPRYRRPRGKPTSRCCRPRDAVVPARSRGGERDPGANCAARASYGPASRDRHARARGWIARSPRCAVAAGDNEAEHQCRRGREVRIHPRSARQAARG